LLFVILVNYNINGNGQAPPNGQMNGNGNGGNPPNGQFNITVNGNAVNQPLSPQAGIK
jgi:hypothetical protein